jgi:hypothetical protein
MFSIMRHSPQNLSPASYRKPEAAAVDMVAEDAVAAATEAVAVDAAGAGAEAAAVAAGLPSALRAAAATPAKNSSVFGR